MQITEDKITDAIMDWMEHADADELAGVAGEIFGGQCMYDEGGEYSFSPDGQYSGVFD